MLEHFVHSLRVFDAIGRLELVDREIGGFLVLGVHDRVQRSFDLCLQACRYCIQDVGYLVPLMPTSA